MKDSQLKQKAEAILRGKFEPGYFNIREFENIVSAMLSLHKELLKETKTIECFVPAEEETDLLLYTYAEFGEFAPETYLKKTTLTVLQSDSD